MTKLLRLLLLLLPTPLFAAITTNPISSLPIITTPSTNTYLEVADMSATPKSRKMVLSDLATAILNGILPNSFDTNVLGTNLLWQPSLRALRINGASPGIVFYNTSANVDKKTYFIQDTLDRLYFVWGSDSGINTLPLGIFDTNGNFVINGSLSLSNQTNLLSMASGGLYMDGVQISAGLLPNSLDTNSLSTNLVWNPTTKALSVSGNSPELDFWNSAGGADLKRYSISDSLNQFRFLWTSDNGGSSLLLGYFDSLGNFNASGYLSLNGQTNQLSMASGNLYYDGVQINGGSSGSPINNFYFNTGRGGHLMVLSNLTTVQIGPNKLVRTDSNTNLAPVTIGTGISFDGTTISSSASGGLGTNGSAYIIVGGSAIATNNWVMLSNAYVTAKAATPHGNALAAGNRYTILLLPGIYDIGATSLTLDTQFIDIVGLSQNTGERRSVSTTGDFGDTILTSSSFPINITVASQDITIANLCLKTTVTGSGASCIGTTEAGFKSGLKVINVLLAYAGSGNRITQWDKNFDGYWEDVRAINAVGSSGNRAFGASVSGAVTINGTFINVIADDAAWGGENNVGVTLSGLFIDCQGGNTSFAGAGATATLSGTFLRCRYNGISAGSMFGGSAGILSGTFEGCQAVDGSTSWGVTMSGTMRNCSKGTPGWTTVTGPVVGCTFANWIHGRTLKTDTTTTGNVGGGEDNLITFSVPAGTLGVNGDTIQFDCAGSFNNSVHNKQLKVYWGTNVVFDTGSLSGATLGASSWRAHGKIIRTGATTQKSTTEFTLSGALLGALTTTTTTYVSCTATLSGAITFKCTGTDLDGTPSNNEVVQELESLTWNPGS